MNIKKYIKNLIIIFLVITMILILVFGCFKKSRNSTAADVKQNNITFVAFEKNSSGFYTGNTYKTSEVENFNATIIVPNNCDTGTLVPFKGDDLEDPEFAPVQSEYDFIFKKGIPVVQVPVTVDDEKYSISIMQEDASLKNEISSIKLVTGLGISYFGVINHKLLTVTFHLPQFTSKTLLGIAIGSAIKNRIYSLNISKNSIVSYDKSVGELHEITIKSKVDGTEKKYKVNYIQDSTTASFVPDQNEISVVFADSGVSQPQISNLKINNTNRTISFSLKEKTVGDLILLAKNKKAIGVCKILIQSGMTKCNLYMTSFEIPNSKQSCLYQVIVDNRKQIISEGEGVGDYHQSKDNNIYYTIPRMIGHYNEGDLGLSWRDSDVDVAMGEKRLFLLVAGSTDPNSHYYDLTLGAVTSRGQVISKSPIRQNTGSSCANSVGVGMAQCYGIDKKYHTIAVVAALLGDTISTHLYRIDIGSDGQYHLSLQKNVAFANHNDFNSVKVRIKNITGTHDTAILLSWSTKHDTSIKFGKINYDTSTITWIGSGFNAKGKNPYIALNNSGNIVWTYVSEDNKIIYYQTGQINKQITNQKTNLESITTMSLSPNDKKSIFDDSDDKRAPSIAITNPEPKTGKISYIMEYQHDMDQHRDVGVYSNGTFDVKNGKLLQNGFEGSDIGNINRYRGGQAIGIDIDRLGYYGVEASLIRSVISSDATSIPKAKDHKGFVKNIVAYTGAGASPFITTMAAAYNIYKIQSAARYAQFFNSLDIDALAETFHTIVVTNVETYMSIANNGAFDDTESVFSEASTTDGVPTMELRPELAWTPEALDSETVADADMVTDFYEPSLEIPEAAAEFAEFAETARYLSLLRGIGPCLAIQLIATPFIMGAANDSIVRLNGLMLFNNE